MGMDLESVPRSKTRDLKRDLKCGLACLWMM